MENHLITEYETEFVNLLHTVELQVGGSGPLETLDATFQELQELLDQMDIEVNNVRDKQHWRSRFRAYKTQWQQWKDRYEQRHTEQRERALLFGDRADGTAGTGAGVDEAQRSQLLSNHHLLHQTGAKLEDATRIALDTEQVGSQIMNQLRTQRETLENTHHTLHAADTQLDKSLRTLRSMTHRLLANKFISYAIIAVLIVLIVCVIYSKF